MSQNLLACAQIPSPQEKFPEGGGVYTGLELLFPREEERTKRNRGSKWRQT